MKAIALPMPHLNGRSMQHFMQIISTGLQWLCFAGFGILAGAMTNAVGPAMIDERTHIPLGMAAGIAVTLVTASMWLSRKLTHLSDQVDALRHELSEVPCKAHHQSRKCPAGNDEVP